MKIFLFIVVLSIISCSKEFQISDFELKKVQELRNKKIMLDDGAMIIPPNFDNIPLEKDSEYEPKKDKKS